MEVTLKSQAEDVQANFGTLRVLLDAVDSRLRFFITEDSLFGAYTDLIRSYALDTQSLLGVLNDYIWQMEKTQDDVVHRIVRARETEANGTDGKAD